MEMKGFGKGLYRKILPDGNNLLDTGEKIITLACLIKPTPDALDTIGLHDATDDFDLPGVGGCYETACAVICLRPGAPPLLALVVKQTALAYIDHPAPSRQEQWRCCLRAW